MTVGGFRDPSRLPQSAYYRPLEDTWFAANALVFGTHPAAWHLAKIVLHLVAVVLCFRVGQLLTGDVATGLLTAAIFGRHPGAGRSSRVGQLDSRTALDDLRAWALIFLIGRKPGWSGGLWSR